MKIEERLAHLLEHGIGCPQAVKLGGEAAIEAWCEQQELTLEANLADAEAQEEATERAEELVAEEKEAATERAEARVAAALAEAEAAGGVEVETSEGEDETPAPLLAHVVAAFPSVLERLDSLESAVDALALSGPTEEAIGAVAASPEPKAKGRKKAGTK